MTARSPSLEELLQRVLDARLATVHVAMPAKVESVDTDAGTVDVTPMVSNVTIGIDDEQIADEPVVVPSVPLVFPRSGGFFLAMPVDVGDTVLLVVCSRSLEEWWSGQDGGPVLTPEDPSHHAMTDAVAIPGLYNEAGKLSGRPTASLDLGEEGGTVIRIESGTVHLGSTSAGDFVALAQKVLTELQSVQTDFSNLLTALNTHVHTSAAAGSPTTPPVPPIVFVPHTPASVAASVTKAD